MGANATTATLAFTGSAGATPLCWPSGGQSTFDLDEQED
jgi:hypothetical protein